MSAPNPLLVDSREGSHRLMRYAAIADIAELARLDAADAMFVGNGAHGPVLVGVEVKSISDLLSSISTGRLQGTQIPAMLATYDVNWLVTYGSYKAGAGNRLEVRRGQHWRTHRIGGRDVPYGYIEGMLIELAAMGIHTKRTWDEAEAAAWLATLHRWYGKEWSAHKGMRTFDNSRTLSLMPDMDEATHLRARVAAQLPSVGFERGVAAAKVFDSVVAMACAGSQEWEKVPGVGRVIAKAVVAALRGK